jgi:hypothetical protein
MTDAPFPVRRFRRNDYVGPPIWGFAIDVPLGRPLATGDRCYFDLDALFGGRRIDLVIDRIDSRFACRYTDTGRFAGFITNK